MSANTTCSDFVQFFRSWVSNPLQVSAIAPSGERLARLMTKEVEALDEAGPRAQARAPVFSPVRCWRAASGV